MTECKYFEYDQDAADEYFAMLQNAAANNPSPYMEGPEPETPCENFCKYFACHYGFPGETLDCCEHPVCGRILAASQEDIR